MGCGRFADAHVSTLTFGVTGSDKRSFIHPDTRTHSPSDRCTDGRADTIFNRLAFAGSDKSSFLPSHTRTHSPSECCTDGRADTSSNYVDSNTQAHIRTHCPCGLAVSRPDDRLTVDDANIASHGTPHLWLPHTASDVTANFNPHGRSVDGHYSHPH